MANTQYAYVRNFELPDPLLPDTFLVVRVDGHAFHRFSEAHKFAKPNDVRALELMDHAARDTMELYPDIVLAFGESDEYSFLLKKSTTIYNRRQSKIVSTLTSQFTSSYVFYWSRYFPDTLLRYPPSFDGRIICYPTEKTVKDYFSWRQADTHINNLYNTTFWALVQQGGQSTTEAHATLRGTFSKDKNEILFSRFNINYNTIHSRFRKGSILIREDIVNEDHCLEGPDIRSTSALVPQNTLSSSFHIPVDQAEDQHNSIFIAVGTPIDSTMRARQSPMTCLAPTSEVLNQEPTHVHPKPHNKAKAKSRAKPKQKMTRIVLLHCDIIHNEFWSSRPDLLTE